jgi:hypothetical protein
MSKQDKLVEPVWSNHTPDELPAGVSDFRRADVLSTRALEPAPAPAGCLMHACAPLFALKGRDVSGTVFLALVLTDGHPGHGVAVGQGGGA